jgi:gluconolactonase
MFFLDAPPRLIETRPLTRLPAAFRSIPQESPWGDEPRGGHGHDCFLEGPSVDADGNLWVVDIPHGRVFRIAPDGGWTLAAEYQGEPNGLKFHPDGRILIADYRNGIVELDPASGRTRPLLARWNTESLKGCNDLFVTAAGDIYFTDQGQSGLSDPSGRVFHRAPDGRLTCLIANAPSPNGIVYSAAERALYVAMTRDNAVWRMPLTRDGQVVKAGRFCSLFGRGGPDGLALDEAGNLAVAHSSLGHVFLFAPDGQCIARVRSCAGGQTTNIAYGGAGRRQLFITESTTGSILVADMDVPGLALPG